MLSVVMNAVSHYLLLFLSVVMSSVIMLSVIAQFIFTCIIPTAQGLYHKQI
jgi:hypothetical protein